MEGSETPTRLLEMKGIKKSFPGTLAVDNVDFECDRGEIRGLVGENGAGKSTLMKVLAGVHMPDSGKILINGVQKRFRNYSDARRAGIGVVYQELSLLPELSVAENIFMGTWPKKWNGLIDWRAIKEKSTSVLADIGIDLDPNELVTSLPMALRQMVAIAKVLTQDPEIIVFDEPTAALSKDEVAELFRILRDTKRKMKGIIFISHRLDEVLEICDTITVMKDGQKVLTEKASYFDEDKLVSCMVGREFSEIFPPKIGRKEDREEIFSYDGILAKSKKRVRFSIPRGDVLGIGGLQGQGQIEVLESIFGLGNCDDLHIKIFGREVTVNNPYHALRQGIALIPENRNEEGVFLILSVLENLVASTIDKRQSYGLIRKEEEEKVARDIVDKLSIKVTSLDQVAQSLSGGNLQKLVLGKWLVSDPKVIVMLEPTKGVDVATKQQIYRLIRDLAESNVAVIVYTSDMLELIGACDRVLVMNQGFLTANLQGDEITEENIMKASVSNKNLLEADTLQ
ncbi:MAG: sugar ABC transporter ATP-binding protein [Deltaproteobacteria bacterium]|nr:sugar ABC transporter ATP-binding protein [Deltaproteobacteria bacterium]MBW2120836.1 sugar ABC transporter ATP-binding protein [Deltaproteobacteria bacterium]